MPEEIDVAKEEALNEEVLDGVAKPDAGESSPPEKGGQEKGGEPEKTREGGERIEAPEPDDMEGVEEGKPIPYDRFKKVIGERNQGRKDNKSITAELEEAQGYINNPDVYRAILSSKGITDKKLQNEKLKEAGFEIGEGALDDDSEKDIKKQLNKLKEGLDLNTQEGWAMYNWRISQLSSKQSLEPFQKQLSDKDFDSMMAEQSVGAKEVAELYGLKYGDEKKDGKDINTGTGILNAYLNQNPKKAAGIKFGALTKADALVLALKDKGFKLGEQKGLDNAKKRNQDLKDSQMEDDSGQIREGEPDGSWDTESLMKWHRKHSK